MSTTSPVTSRASANAEQAADESRDPISVTSGLPSSCDRCRRRKSRCDRGFPSCQRCISARVACQYGNRRRPGFSAGHRQVLESRIRELEGMVQNLQSSSSQQSYPSTRTPNYSLEHESAHDARPSHDRMSQDDFNARNLNQGPTPASTHDSNREGQGKPDMPSKPSDWVFQGTFARTVALVERRPPLDLVVSSTSVFFRHIHPWFPFLDSQLVLNDLAGVQEPALLHYAIFGASIPFLFDPRLDDTRSDSFWKYTKRRIFVETSEEPSYAGLEAATILTLDLSGMTNGPQVWSRLAVVCRLAAQLRTASGKSLRQSAPGSSWPGRNAANRPSSLQHAKLFWSIYALDCLISITTSQPGLLTEHILRPFRETREAAWSDQEITLSEGAGTRSRSKSSSAYSPSAVFLSFLQLLDISRTFHDLHLTYIGLDSHDETQAAAWLESCSNTAETAYNLLQGLPSWCQIPISLESDTNSGPHIRQINSSAMDGRMRDTQAPIIMLHAYGQALTIYLNGLLECSTHQGLLAHAADSQHSASILCRRSVRVIVHISAAFVDTYGDRIGWPFAWSIWTAARYLLASMHAARSSQPSPDFYTLLSCLREMGKYWQISKKYWWLLHHAANAAVGTGEAMAGARDGQSILHGDNERLLNPRRILAIVADLRVPTSDVEDQFRVDPVFSATSASESSTGDVDADAPIMDCQGGAAFASGREADVDHTIFLDDMTRDDSLYWSDTWFNTPLFATSGYQQLGEGPDGIMDSTMRLA